MCRSFSSVAKSPVAKFASSAKPLAILLLVAALSPLLAAQSSSGDLETSPIQVDASSIEGGASPVELLTIGSKAPPLNIEHWLSNRQGALPAVTEFQKGKVYVIEFWATWCGPCIASMPKLAELQGKYLDRGVQIISVGEDDLETVKLFLQREVRNFTKSQDKKESKAAREDEAPQTYAELTSHWCLTADPDGSVHRDYMLASRQRGIPTAFIVGKSGLIEWFGHVASLENPLAKVVADQWDREKFIEVLRKREEEAAKQLAVQKVLKKIWDLKEAGDYDSALSELDVLRKDFEADSLVYQQCDVIRTSLIVEKGGPQAIEAFSAMTGDEINPQLVDQIAWSVVVEAQKVKAQNGVFDQALLKAASDAARRAVDASRKAKDNEVTASILDTLANLLFLGGNLDEAIAVQKQATELSDDEQFLKFYKQLLEAR